MVQRLNPNLQLLPCEAELTEDGLLLLLLQILLVGNKLSSLLLERQLLVRQSRGLERVVFLGVGPSFPIELNGHGHPLAATGAVAE